MPIKFLQRYLRRMKRHTGSTFEYMRLSFEGNRIERVTDFKAMRRPILLLHGYGASRRVFNLLEGRLRKDGFSVFSLNLGGIFDKFNTKSIPQLARHVAQKIESLYQRHSIKDKLVIIGHSKGGLIGRCYIKDFNGRKRVKQLITLGTPHRGNPWAMLGLLTPLGFFTRSLRQMAPISPFIRRLNKTPWPRGVKVVSIFSKADTMCPYPSPVLQTWRNSSRIKNIEVADVGHAEFLATKKVYRLIRRELLEEIASAGHSPIRRKRQKSHLDSRSKLPARREPSAIRI